MTIEKAGAAEAKAVAALYDNLIDHLNATDTNYPRWTKGLYPTAELAWRAYENGWLFVGKIGASVVASCILNQSQDPLYAGGAWQIEPGDDKILAIHTLCVHPDHLRHGLAARMLAFAEGYGRDLGCLAARLDTAAQNIPGINMYERHGYRCAGIVDLKLGRPGLTVHRLYEKAL